MGVFNTADVLDGWEDEWRRLGVSGTRGRMLDEGGQPTPVCYISESSHNKGCLIGFQVKQTKIGVFKLTGIQKM